MVESAHKKYDSIFDQLAAIVKFKEGTVLLQNVFDALSDVAVIELIGPLLTEKHPNDIDTNPVRKEILHLLLGAFDNKYWSHRFARIRKTCYQFENISAPTVIAVLDYYHLLVRRENILTGQAPHIDIDMDKDDSCGDCSKFTVQQLGNCYFIGVVESEDNPCMRHWPKYGTWRRLDLALYKVSRDPTAAALTNQHLCTLDIWHVSNVPNSEDDLEDEVDVTSHLESLSRCEKYQLAEPFLITTTKNELRAAFIPHLPLQFVSLTLDEPIYAFPRIEDAGNFAKCKTRTIPIITKSDVPSDGKSIFLKVQLVEIRFDARVTLRVVWKCLLDQRGRTDLLKHSFRVSLTHAAFSTRVKSTNSRVVQACLCRVSLQKPTIEKIPFFNFTTKNVARNFHSYIVRYYRVGHQSQTWSYWNSNFILLDLVGSTVYVRQHFACSIHPPFTDLSKEPLSYRGKHEPKIYKVNFDKPTNSDKLFELMESKPHAIDPLPNRVYLDDDQARIDQYHQTFH